MVAYALMMTVPLALAVLLLWGGRPTVSLAASRPPALPAEERDRLELIKVSRPPAVSLTIEPAAPTPYAEAEPPVVLQNYLLPDDGGEEPSHAGS